MTVSEINRHPQKHLPDSTALVPFSRLQGGKRLLYMTHLAIGDFVYQGALLQALKARFPQLQIDVWFDDFRHSAKSWQQGRNRVLGQWLEAEPYIGQVYPIASNGAERDQMVAAAREADYDLIVFTGALRQERFARFARMIGPKAYIAGIVAPDYRYSPLAWFYFRRIDRVAWFTANDNSHISAQYAERFRQLFGFELKDDEQVALCPRVSDHFRHQAAATLSDWSSELSLNDARIILINPLSTNIKRDLSLTKLSQIMQALYQKRHDLLFVINLPEESVIEVQEFLQQDPLVRELPWRTYTAAEHFMQIPAMLEQADIVLSVETAIMHLASGLDVCQVVVMRDKAQNWQPLRADEIIFTPGRVDEVAVPSIIARIERYL